MQIRASSGTITVGFSKRAEKIIPFFKDKSAVDGLPARIHQTAIVAGQERETISTRCLWRSA
jgi:hypothetical protein